MRIKKTAYPLIPAAMLTIAVQAGADEQAAEASGEQSAWQETKRSLAEVKSDVSSATSNAWLHGKLEATLLLNRHLNNFAINTDVQGNTAYLTGTVRTDIDRDLAEVVALNVDGIENVENNIAVDAKTTGRAQDDPQRDFGQRIEDATTTAIVKSKLLANRHIKGMAIDVDTRNSVVTLSGNVATSEVKSLVENVAAATDSVDSVVNELSVDS